MEIIEDLDNEVLKRKQVKVIVEAEKNPTINEAMDIISREFKVDKDKIVIKLVKGKFGRKTFLIHAFIYNSKEDKEKIEPKKKVKEEAGEEKAEEKKEESTAEEKPAEEKKEAEESKEEKSNQGENKEE